MEPKPCHMPFNEILSLPLIQIEQLIVSKFAHLVLVNRLYPV